MKPRTTHLALLLILSSLADAHGRDRGEFPFPRGTAAIDSTFDTPLSVGLDLIARGRHDAAIALFDSLQRAFPRHPAPHLYVAAAYQDWMLVNRLNDFEDHVQESVELAIDKGNALLRTSEDSWLRFYIGAAYGYRALYRFRRHSWVGAYLDSRRSVASFDHALAAMPDLYDCYFGLGSYHYWRTARSGLLRLVAFWIRDRRQLGLEELRFAVRHGRYSAADATYGLTNAYYDFGDYDRALTINEMAMKLADPPSNGALYMRGRIMARLGNWPDAEAAYRELLSRLPARSIGYQVECKYWIAEALNAQHRMAEAHEVSSEALTQSRSRNKATELESALDGFDSIRDRLEMRHRQIEQTIGVEAVPATDAASERVAPH
jgi:tetratricopeptide (TPR) repeat protein